MNRFKISFSALALAAVALSSVTGAENTFAESRFTAISSSNQSDDSGYIGLIRDSAYPDAASTREQYRAYADDDGYAYLGYSFGGEYSVNTLVYTPGYAGEEGGWFSGGEVWVEVLSGGVWQKTEAYFTPDYPVSEDYRDFTSVEYVINLEPTEAYGIRIAGKAGGVEKYISCSELRVLCDLDSEIAETDEPSLWLEPSSTPIAAVTNPDISGGSRNIRDINDGYIPSAGDSYSLQYDTVTADGKKTPHEEYIGLMFGGEYEIELVEFTEGGNFVDGGWFADGTMALEVNIGYKWVEVGFTCAPEYPDSNDRADFLPDFETYTLTLSEPLLCRGVRLRGKAGGDANFISCGEFRVKKAAQTLSDEPEAEAAAAEAGKNQADETNFNNQLNIYMILTVIIILTVSISVISAKLTKKRKKNSL